MRLNHPLQVMLPETWRLEVPPSEHRDPAVQWPNDLKVLFYRGWLQARGEHSSLPSPSSWLELDIQTSAQNRGCSEVLVC